MCKRGVLGGWGWLVGPLPSIITIICVHHCLAVWEEPMSFTCLGLRLSLKGADDTALMPHKVVAQIEVQLLELLVLFQVPFMEAVLVKKKKTFSLLIKYSIFIHYYIFFSNYSFHAMLFCISDVQSSG